MPQRSNSARYLWGDRNPAAKTIGYANTLAPHALTTRATYTVPAGKKAAVSSFAALVQIVTAASPAGDRLGAVLYTPSGGSELNTIYNLLPAAKNTIGDQNTINYGTGFLMLPGDSTRLATYDLGTGGTVTYVLSETITEYDA